MNGRLIGARAWHLATALVSAAALVTQVVLVLRGVNVLTDSAGNLPSIPERLLRFLSYFTVESNCLVIATSLSLAVNPTRDGKVWRVLRLDALVGITVTLVVYHLALRPLLDLHGLAKATDTGFHYVAPIMAVVGWLLYGPRPRVDVATLWWSLCWPIGYFCYTLGHGAASGWYPYPFVDAATNGYAFALRNALLVLFLLLGVGATYLTLDSRLLSTLGRAR